MDIRIGFGVRGNNNLVIGSVRIIEGSLP